jgi:Na+-driven multidrug efflux pump
METALKKPDMGEIRRKIYKMILPITIEKILQMTAGLVSAGMIGRIDAQAIGAAGISQRIVQIIWAVFNGMTTGATVYVAQAYGAKDYDKLKKVIQQALLFSIGLVILLQQLVFWKAPDILKIFGSSGEMLSKAADYLRIASWGLPFWAIVLIVAGVLQGMGNTKTPMLVAMFMNFVNTVSVTDIMLKMR